MKLNVGKSYNLSTVQKSITKKKVKVVGFINYTEALDVPYNIRNLAINEKVIPSDDESNSYLENLNYFKCVVLKSDNTNIETSEYVLVWDEIIDSNSTTELNIEYSLDLQLKINPNSDYQINEVMEGIQNYISTNYENAISSSIKINNVSSNISIDNNTENLLNNMEKMKEMLKESTNVLMSLLTMKNSTETLITKMENLNLSTDFNTISEKTEQILTLVNEIYANVK